MKNMLSPYLVLAQQSSSGAGTAMIPVVGIVVAIGIAIYVRSSKSKNLSRNLAHPTKATTNAEGQLFTAICTVIGSVMGLIFVRAFLLTDIESIGFSIFWNNFGNLDVGSLQIAVGSSTFWKCLIGAVLGGFITGHGYRIYSVKNIATVHVGAPKNVMPSAATRLSELSELRDKGLISKDDYEKRKSEIISLI